MRQWRIWRNVIQRDSYDAVLHWSVNVPAGLRMIACISCIFGELGYTYSQQATLKTAQLFLLIFTLHRVGTTLAVQQSDMGHRCLQQELLVSSVCIPIDQPA